MWDLIASVPDHCLSFYFSLRVFTLSRFILSLMLLVVVFQSCLALRSPRLGRVRAAFVCLYCMRYFSSFSPPLCVGCEFSGLLHLTFYFHHLKIVLLTQSVEKMSVLLLMRL